MTSNEFHILDILERTCERQGLIPRGASVKQLQATIYDEGLGDLDTHEITTNLVSMRRRKLVVSRPGGDGALWLCTLYGRNVVSA